MSGKMILGASKYSGALLLRNFKGVVKTGLQAVQQTAVEIRAERLARSYEGICACYRAARRAEIRL
jgi:hypothetical protein